MEDEEFFLVIKINEESMSNENNSPEAQVLQGLRLAESTSNNLYQFASLRPFI